MPQPIQAMDQATLGWMESQAARIERDVKKEKLSKIRYPELVTVDTQFDETDDVLVTYVEGAGVGRMTPLAPGATDLPKVEVEYDRITRKAYMEGISYGWDDFEVRKARRLGKNLMNARVRTCYRIAEEHKEDVIFNGDKAKGWPGLFRNRDAASTYYSAPAAWTTSDTTAIFDSIRAAFQKIFVDTNEVMVPDTLLLPSSMMPFLTTMIKDANSTTAIPIMEYIRRYNPYSVMYPGREMMIRTIPQLSTAGPASGNPLGTNNDASGHPMALMYDSSSDVLRFLLAQDLTFIGPQRHAWTQQWYGRMVLGGLQILHPKGLCYITNIGSAA